MYNRTEKLDIRYSRDAKIAAVAPFLWHKLGPDKWFDGYNVVCASAYGSRLPWAHSLDLEVGDIEPRATRQLINSSKFKILAQGDLSDYRFLLHSPTNLPEGISKERFIYNQASLSRFENKRYFRSVFNGQINIPEHVIVPVSELLAKNPNAAYSLYSAQLGPTIVVQDEIGSGSRATFIVRSKSAMSAAIAALAAKDPGERKCVISRFIVGKERSIQVCVLPDRLVVGPAQQQLIRSPELLNPDLAGGMFFCGGRIVQHGGELVEGQIKQIVEIIGQKLQAEGYKGIFGIDFIVDGSGRVYALEVNARATGMLPLINEQPESLPLFLLHILELAGEPYDILHDSARPTIGSGPQSILGLFNKQQSPASFEPTIKTGNYKLKSSGLELIDESPHWNPDADLLLHLFCSPNAKVNAGKRMCSFLLRSTGFDNNGCLHQDAKQAVKFLEDLMARA